MVLFRRRVSRDECLRFIEAHIEHGNEWVRAAFYSDPLVERILSTLYQRWRENEETGEPIDYATDDEVKQLYELAKRYAALTPYEAYAIYMRRLEEREGEEGEDAV